MQTSPLALAVQEAQLYSDDPSTDLLSTFTSLNDAIAAHPKNVHPLLAMGTFLLKSHAFSLRGASMDYFRQALALEPENHRAMTGLGIGYLKCGDDNGALHYLKDANKAKPDALLPAFILGAAYLKKGHMDAVKNVTMHLIRDRADQGCGALYIAANNFKTDTDVANLQKLFGRTAVKDMKDWAKDAVAVNRSGEPRFRREATAFNAYGLTSAFGLLSDSSMIRFQPHNGNKCARFVIGG